MEPQTGEAALTKIAELEQQLQQSHAKLQKAENAKKKLREHVVSSLCYNKQHIPSRCWLAAALAAAGAAASYLVLLLLLLQHLAFGDPAVAPAGPAQRESDQLTCPS
jgi:hypothetical protein